MESKNTPKLRFPGFEGETLKTVKLKDISSKISDGIHSTPIYDDKGDYYFINGNNLVKNRIVFNKDTKKVSSEEYLKYKKDLNSQTVLISLNGTIGNLAFFNNEKIILGKSAAFINLNRSIDKYYIINYLQILRVFKYFYAELTGTTIKNLSLKSLKNTLLYLPSEAEQHKIAQFLLKVDKKISLLNKKYEKYLKFKEFLMQNLFTQKLRFKNPNNQYFSEWEEYVVSNCILENNIRNNENKDYPLISSTLNGIYLQSEYFDKNVASTDTTNYKLINKGLFTYRSMSDTGVFRFNIQNLFDIALVSPAYPVFDVNEFINSKFFEYYLNNSSFIKKQLLYVKEGGTRYALSISKFKKIKVLLPSFEEQRKIADFLSAIDKKINLIQNQITQMEEFKKGLLQQMFVYIIQVKTTFVSLNLIHTYTFINYLYSKIIRL